MCNNCDETSCNECHDSHNNCNCNDDFIYAFIHGYSLFDYHYNKYGNRLDECKDIIENHICSECLNRFDDCLCDV